MKGLLVSIDVGGTLGHADRPSLAAILADASPLDPGDARRIIRQKLFVQPEISPWVVADACDALRIPSSAFPSEVEALPFRLAPATLPVLQAISHHATLVTLSNVTCLEADNERLRDLLHPWVQDFFPSCRIGYAKPDPAAWHHIARVFHTSPPHMVHIGDDWTCDIVGARSAGITAIWISNGRRLPHSNRLTDSGVLVATNLVEASQQLIQLAVRRSI